MVKKLKTGLIVLLSALLIFSCAILLLKNNVVFADSTQIEDDSELTDDLVTSDDYFAYAGATVDPEQFAIGVYELGLRIDGVSTYWGDLSDYLSKSYKHALMSSTYYFSSTVTYRIKIYRDNADGETKTALGEYVVFFRGNYNCEGTNNAIFKAVYYKNLTYCNETFAFPANANAYDHVDNINGKPAAEYAVQFFPDYEVVSAGIVMNDGVYDCLIPTEAGMTPHFTVGITTESAIQNYSIEFTHTEKIGKSVDFSLFRGYVNAKYETTTGTITSPSRSVKRFLTDWRTDDEEGFAAFWTDYYSEETLQAANDIIDSLVEKKITVKYLVPIEGTPFSTDTYHEATVKVPNGKITIPDILAAIDADTFICNGSYVEGLVLDDKGTINDDTDDVYVVEYLTDSWLRAVTVDGKYYDYFADINKSYYAYYHHYVDEGVIREEIYEYILSMICAEYPIIGEQYSATPNRIYGKWGMAVLPETYTLNSLWAEMFTNKTTHGAQVCHFSWTATIEQSEYDALQTQYEYGWLQRAWNNLAGAIDTYQATYYLFYTDPDTSVSWVDQRGEIETDEEVKDPNQGGAIVEDVKDGTETVKQAWDSLLGVFKGLTGSSWTIVGVAVVAGLAFLVYRYFFGGSGSKKSGTTSKKRKK